MLLITLGVIVLAGVFTWLGPASWTSALRQLQPAALASLLGLALASFAIRALRWQLLCRHARVRLPLLQNTACYMAGFAFAVTPGYVGELIRLWLLRRYHGYRYERTAAPMLLERLSDAVALLLLCLLGVARWLDRSLTVVALMLAVAGSSRCCCTPTGCARRSRAPTLGFGGGRGPSRDCCAPCA